MMAYLLRRLFWLALTLLAVSAFTFAIIFAGPVDPVQALVGPRAQGEALAALRRQLGLDRPLYVQYADYMGKLLRGDLGYSFFFKRPVSQALFSRLPATAQLAGCIMGLSLVFGLPMGIVTALKRGSLLDHSMTVAGLVLISMPSFFFGLLLIYFLAFKLNLFPTGGYGSLRHLILPGLSVALPWSVWYGTILRANLLYVLSTDYVRTAYAKGLWQRLVVFRHALKNAMLPLVTMLGMDLASLLTGTALVEYVFNWPGIGWQALTAAQHRDVPMVMGSVLFGAALIGLANLGVDILYSFLDPRVRLA
jgi:peptide/nickel transport system permease protein